MSISEQKKRKFKPLNIEPASLSPDSFYKSYIAFGVATDTRIFKTSYVIYTDIENYPDRDAGGLVGIAIRRFDAVVGALSLTASDWFSKNYSRDPQYKGCDYQISKIYKLENEQENPIEYTIVRGGGSQINLPDAKANFSKLDSVLLDKILKMRDDTFKKSLKYLLNGERAMYLGLPFEKIILDFMKSIEVIVKSFASKKRKTFKQQLKECAKKIGLTEKEKQQIIQLWKDRSNGDVAHAKKVSRSEYLPPQYPVPSDVEGVISFKSDLAVAILLKYFKYKDGEIKVIIDNERYHQEGDFVDVNMGSYFTYKPRQAEKNNITKVLKQQISQNLKVKYKNISKRSEKSGEFIFKIKQ